MRPLERILLIRAEEQVARVINDEPDDHRWRAKATGTCECGRPLFKGRARCCQCVDRERQASPEHLRSRAEKCRAATAAQRTVVAHVLATVGPSRAEDVAYALGLDVGVASQALWRAVRQGWLRRVGGDGYVAGGKKLTRKFKEATP